MTSKKIYTSKYNNLQDVIYSLLRLFPISMLLIYSFYSNDRTLKLITYLYTSYIVTYTAIEWFENIVCHIEKNNIETDTDLNSAMKIVDGNMEVIWNTIVGIKKDLEELRCNINKTKNDSAKYREEMEDFGFV